MASVDLGSDGTSPRTEGLRISLRKLAPMSALCMATCIRRSVKFNLGQRFAMSPAGILSKDFMAACHCPCPREWRGHKLPRSHLHGSWRELS